MEEAVSTEFSISNMKRVARAMKVNSNWKQSEIKNKVISKNIFSNGCISGELIAD